MNMKHRIKRVLSDLGFHKDDVEILSQDIFETYTSVGRNYHDINHILNMLNNFDEFMRCSESAQKIKNAKEFMFAIIMHDYVHGNANDVDDSIKKSKEFLYKVSSRYNCDYVAALIKATDYDKCEDVDFDGQLMQDLDLQTLGAVDTEYDKYANQIRQEYQQYSDDIFYAERVKILNVFLNRVYIFNTEYYRNKYEQVARNNIARELLKITN